MRSRIESRLYFFRKHILLELDIVHCLPYSIICFQTSSQVKCARSVAIWKVETRGSNAKHPHSQDDPIFLPPHIPTCNHTRICQHILSRQFINEALSTRIETQSLPPASLYIMSSRSLSQTPSRRSETHHVPPSPPSLFDLLPPILFPTHAYNCGEILRMRWLVRSRQTFLRHR